MQNPKKKSPKTPKFKLKIYYFSFDGKVSKLGENLWEVIKNEDLSDVELGFKVVFSGFDVESEENVIVVALMNFMIKNLESAQNIKILQVGDQAINAENIVGSNQEFRNSIW